MDPVELTDDLLLVRPWRVEDAADVYAACQDPEVQRWTTVPSPYRRRDAHVFVAELSPQAWASGSAAYFGVFDKGTGRLVGASGLHRLADVGSPWGGSAELGYWTAAHARRRGLTVASSRLACRWGFQALGLTRITWWANVGNVGSRRVAEGVGFRLEGTARAALVHRGARVDGWFAGLLPGDLDG